MICSTKQSFYRLICVCMYTFSFRYEGPLGFYKGLKPNLMRVVPATAITFVVYEQVSHFLLRRQ